MQGNRNNVWRNGKDTTSYYLWVLSSLWHKIMSPVGSLWASVSRAADEVNTREISVSILCVALSFVNIHNRLAAFLQTHQPDLVIPCWTKYAQGQHALVGLWLGHACNTGMLIHAWRANGGKEASERVRELCKYPAYVRISWDIRKLTFLNLPLFKEHCVPPLHHQLVHSFVVL